MDVWYGCAFPCFYFSWEILKNYDRRNPLFSSFSQLSDTTSHFFSGWKRVCTMYNFASFPFLLKNDWYHFFLPCKCFMPFSKKIENGSDVQGKLLRNKKLFYFLSTMLCGHRTVSQAKSFGLEIWTCSGMQELFWGESCRTISGSF